jgi:hypothetical protein
MTGCGCLLLVALLGFLLYLFTFGATDTGEQVQQAVALGIGLYGLARTRAGLQPRVRTSNARTA